MPKPFTRYYMYCTVHQGAIHEDASSGCTSLLLKTRSTVPRLWTFGIWPRSVWHRCGVLSVSLAAIHDACFAAAHGLVFGIASYNRSGNGNEVILCLAQTMLSGSLMYAGSDMYCSKISTIHMVHIQHRTPIPTVLKEEIGPRWENHWKRSHR